MTEEHASPRMAVGEPATGEYFVSAYPPFSCWTREQVPAFRRVLERPHAVTEEPSLGLYVHLPFCLRRCEYCYYLSYDDRSSEIDRYVDALARELALYAETPAIRGRGISFAYFGGGTPSVLSPSRIRRLMEGLGSVLSWANAREVTFECAPKTVAEDKLRVLRDSGVTRLSLGVQQLDDRVLVESGRIHLVADVDRAYESIRKVGFDVVNLDLIVGMVGETDSSFRESLDRVIGMDPESVTIYQLEVRHNAPLFRTLRDGALASPPAPWDVKRARLAKGFARLEEAGYTIRSAYAAVRDPVRHRFVYQDDQYRGADLLGIGASAFSYISGVHHQNSASLDDYLGPLDEGRLPLGRAYDLDDEERLVREFVLQMKLGGVRVADFRARFGVDVAGRFREPIERFAARGWIEARDDAIRFTREGLLRADRLIRELYLPAHRET